MAKYINPKRRFFSVQLPEWLLSRTELTMTAKVAYGYLILRFNEEKGEAWPSQSKMADDLGCSDRSVRNALTQLEDQGLIETAQQGHGRSLRYKFLEHEWFPPTGHAEKSSGSSENIAGLDAENIATPIVSNTVNKSTQEDHTLSSPSIPVLVKVEEEVLVNLNTATGRRYRPTKDNLKFVKRQLKDYPPEDLNLVIEYVAAKWVGDDFWHRLVRPQTIFGEKFSAYLAQAEEWNQNGRPAKGKNGKPKESMAEEAARRAAAAMQSQQSALEVN